MSEIKLNIGCINKKPGYTHVDVVNHKCVDVVADARDLPWEDGEVSEIYSN
ncbi:unnamed protein product, partial [marine sediment metagenome]